MREFQPQLRAHLAADPGPYPVLTREQKKKNVSWAVPTSQAGDAHLAPWKSPNPAFMKHVERGLRQVCIPWGQGQRGGGCRPGLGYS